MPTTANKGYEVQTTGSNPGTWGTKLNDDVITIVDNNMGGIAVRTVAGSNITLSASESQMAIVRLTGTQSANIQVTTACVGFFFVENLATGAFNTTVTNGIAGVIVPKGRCTCIADTTNGVRIASSTGGIDPGTVMLFRQTTAPTGWTKATSDNDKALRIVSGAVSSGGTVAFTTLFTGVPTGTISATTLTASQIPAHTHFVFNDDNGPNEQVTASQYAASRNQHGTNSTNVIVGGTATVATTGISSSVGGGQSHGHTFTGTTNLALQYVDVIAATRDG